MRYYLFLDESGDQNLAHYDASFPIFTLCGILVSDDNYRLIGEQIIALKRKFWGERKVILHSRDIRKCEKGFEMLFDLDVKKDFYQDINSMMQDNNYTVISCSIKKDEYIRKYGRLQDVYALSLSFIIERAVFYLDSQNDTSAELYIYAEKRGKKEDASLLNYYKEVLNRGTYFVTSGRIKSYFKGFEFKSKKENIIGLQLADLVAYPVTRYVLDSKASNAAFDIIEPKIYTQGGRQHGLKVFP
jgi:hypothetical protein